MLGKTLHMSFNEHEVANRKGKGLLFGSENAVHFRNYSV